MDPWSGKVWRRAIDQARSNGRPYPMNPIPLPPPPPPKPTTGSGYAGAAKEVGLQAGLRYCFRKSTLDQRGVTRSRVAKRPAKYPRPEPVTRHGIMEWEVEAFRESRMSPARGLQYQVKWAGWPVDRTWYPAENFKTAPSALFEFHASNLGQPGPPARLDQWLNSFHEGLTDVSHVDDNKAAVNWWNMVSLPTDVEDW